MKRLKEIFMSWWRGDYDLEPDELPLPEEKKAERRAVNTEIKHPRVHHAAYVLTSAVCLCCLCFLLLGTVADMPRYGTDPEYMDTVTYEYIENGMKNTGAVNIVSGIILEYRAFDTLGESFVLFCALTCVLALLRIDSDEEGVLLNQSELEYRDLTGDPILKRTVCFVSPIIFVFGIYMLLNGHLSPGGGFSGGAVLGAALILFSAAYGDAASGKFLSEKRFRIVTLIALSFYCLSKSYTFFTGANGIESVIGNGTPGNILSAGLILPLNIAVGMVVACTMYGIYRMFAWRRF